MGIVQVRLKCWPIKARGSPPVWMRAGIFGSQEGSPWNARFGGFILSLGKFSGGCGAA